MWLAGVTAGMVETDRFQSDCSSDKQLRAISFSDLASEQLVLSVFDFLGQFFCCNVEVDFVAFLEELLELPLSFAVEA